MKTIGIISLAGCVKEEQVNLAKLNLEKLGFNVKLSSNILNQDRYLAGSDEDKLKALYEFILDEKIDIIMATRGGYGSIRLVNKLDYKKIKQYPKQICGYSDITALLLMIYKKTGLQMLHGPMAVSDFVEPKDFTVQAFKQVIDNNDIVLNVDKVIKQGDVSGIIWGGNLSTVVSLCGLDFIPKEDFIFFAEDLNEPAYKIDKMFTQLFNIAEFKKYCKGVILGDFLDVDNYKDLTPIFLEIPVPTYSVLFITHGDLKITVPIGKKCIINNNTIVIS